MKTNELLEGALDLASRGWAVVPLHGFDENKECTCYNDCGKDAGKHPRMSGRYESYATTDPITIRHWWETWPESNIGLVCGKQSGIWVLDVDPDGLDDLEDFELNSPHGAGLPETPRVVTGRGGYHYYFLWDPDDRVTTRIGIRPGIDIKANGHVVAPPSVHASGALYTWGRELLGLRRPSAELLRWLKPGYRSATRSGSTDSPTAESEAEDEFPSIQEMLESGLKEGQRDAGLFHAALTLLNHGMSMHEVEELVQQIARQCEPPFSQKDAHRKVEAAQAYRERADERIGVEEWWRTYDPEAASSKEGSATTATSEDGPSSNEKSSAPKLWAGFGILTDRGNALRLRERWPHARPLDGGGWLVWDEETGRWNRTGRPLLEAATVLCDILEHEIVMSSSSAADAIAKWRITSQSAGKGSAALQFLESDPKSVVNGWETDPDPWMLLVRNGALNLRTGELRQPELGDYFTRQANAEWKGWDVPAPTFVRTIRMALRSEQPDAAQEIEDALQLFFGVTLAGVPTKNFIVLHGPGNSGKSSVIEGFAHAMGSYAAVAPRGLLTRKGLVVAGDHPTLLTELEGRRFVFGVEPAAGEELNVELIKDITSGGSVRARKMREDFYEFPVRAKVLIDTNHPLRLRETSQALEERVISLGFRTPVAQSERRNREWVKRQMADEASGILAWAMQGLKKVLASAGTEGVGDLGQMLGGTILEERRQMVSEQDVVGRWIEERTAKTEELDKNAHGDEVGLLAGITVAEARQDFVMWAAEEGVSYSVELFSRELSAGLEVGRWGMKPTRKLKRRWNGAQPTHGWPGLALITRAYRP